jgi:hypothetical protein
MSVGAPKGNTNGAKQKRLVTDCIKRELTQRPQEILAIVNKAIEQAREGDSTARAWLVERSDGKVAQPLVGGDDDDDNPIKIIGRIELTDLIGNGTSKASEEA